jgi:hypothetical protein
VNPRIQTQPHFADPRHHTDASCLGVGAPNLVSGANRGLGKSCFAVHRREADRRGGYLGSGLGLVKALSARDNVIVFAGARDPAAAKDIHALAAARPGKLYVVKLVSSDPAGNAAAISFVREKAGRLDMVIANAGRWMHALRLCFTLSKAGRRHQRIAGSTV